MNVSEHANCYTDATIYDGSSRPVVWQPAHESCHSDRCNNAHSVRQYEPQLGADGEAERRGMGPDDVPSTDGNQHTLYEVHSQTICRNARRAT